MSLDDQTLWCFCRDKGFRYQLVATAIGEGLARQIREMRAAKGWTQATLAKRAGLHQPDVARLERSCENVTISTLRKIASAFDVALIVRFESWSDFLAGLSNQVVPLSRPDDLASHAAPAAPKETT